MKRLGLIASLLAVLFAGVSPASTTAAADPVCGTGAAHPASYDHVIVIAFENKAAKTVFGPDGQVYADYINSLGDQCAKHLSYAGDAAFPSLPQYLEATSGTNGGIVSDCSPSTACETDATSIFDQLRWRVFAEGMPGPCATRNAGDTGYAVRHNPAVYYTSISSECALRDVPLPQDAPLVGARLTWITPDLCHDMHDLCATPTEHFPNGCTDPALDSQQQRNCRVETGDEWLESWLPANVLDRPIYQAGNTAVLLWWDEGAGHFPDLVPLVAISPSIPPGTVAAPALVRTHVDFLRTIEAMTDKPCLAAACTAVDMQAELGLQ